MCDAVHMQEMIPVGFNINFKQLFEIFLVHQMKDYSQNLSLWMSVNFASVLK